MRVSGSENWNCLATSASVGMVIPKCVNRCPPDERANTAWELVDGSGSEEDRGDEELDASEWWIGGDYQSEYSTELPVLYSYAPLETSEQWSEVELPGAHVRVLLLVPCLLCSLRRSEIGECRAAAVWPAVGARRQGHRAHSRTWRIKVSVFEFRFSLTSNDEWVLLRCTAQMLHACEY